MRTLWRGLVRIVFWSFERGTWPYDVAVVADRGVRAVLTALLVERPAEPEAVTASATAPAMVELRGSDPVDGGADLPRRCTFDCTGRRTWSNNCAKPCASTRTRLRATAGSKIVRVMPVRGPDGAITYYDVCIKP